MAENTKAKAKKSRLDKSIDLGMDQFGRFVRLRWFWLVVVSIIIWYTFVFIVPQLSAPSPGSILYYAFQISFALLFGIMQFVAIFWFLGRPRLYWVMPGETGVTFEDYKGNPEVLEAARRIVGLLRGGMMGLMGGAGTGGLNQLLMEMDPPNIETGWFKKILRTIGLTHSRVQNEPVLTVAATNIPESLDRALLRPGRFVRKIHVAPPTDKYRAEVILYYLKKVEHDPDISINALVQRLVDYTPVAIKHVINEAVIIAHFDGRDKITYKDLIEAQDVHEFGLRQTSELTPIDRRRLAYHEAGHAVASYYLYERYFPAYVTIHQRSDLEGAAAFALPRPKESIKTLSKEDILARIQVALAARATEELFLDLNMNGVSSDLSQATTNAFAYVGLWGMDGTLASAKVTEVPQTKLDERVENLLQAQFKAVRKLLQDHSEALIAVAEALIDRDELVAEEIKQLIDESDARQVTKVVLSDFEALLGNGNGNGNGHRKGKNGNGYTLVGGNGNGSAKDSPRIGSTPLSSLPPTNEVVSVEQPFPHEDTQP